MRAIARARRRMTPPIPLSLSEWPAILNSIEWRPRLGFCNGTVDMFFQGPLEILEENGTIQFVGVVFSNRQFLQQMNIHFSSVETLCIDGTFQVRPSHPPDIAQLLTVLMVFNNVVINRIIKYLFFNLQKSIMIQAIPIVHALLTSHTTAVYCRVMQYIRHDLNLNLNYENIQIITDFEQGLRNGVLRVFPEVTNTGCWFHYIRV